MNYSKGLIISLMLSWTIIAQTSDIGSSGRKVAVYHEIFTTAELNHRPASLKRLDSVHVPRLRKLDSDAFNKKRLDAIKNWRQNDKLLRSTTLDKPSKSINYKAQASDIFGIGNNFTAATISTVKNYVNIPPNLNGWVGPQQYILMTYQIIRSFDKITGEPDGVLNIDAPTFFGTAVDDVRIDYDRFAKQWYMSCENALTGVSTDIILAICEDSVITKCTKWHFYTISLEELGASAVSTDYQQLAVDQNAVYINVDVFDAAGNSGASVIVFQKSSLLELNPVVTIFDEVLPSQPLYPPNSAGNPNNFIPPADNFDRNPQFGYLIHANCAPNNVLVPVAYNQLQLWRIANPASDTPTLVGSGINPAQTNPINIDIPTYVTCGNAPHKGNLYGANGFLQTSDGSFLFAPQCVISSSMHAILSW